MNKRSIFIKNTKGSVAIEFALVAPAMLLMLLVIIDAGHSYLIRNNLQFALDAAARYVMINPSASSEVIEGQVEAYLETVTEEDIEVTIEDVTINSKAYKHITLEHDLDTISSNLIGDGDEDDEDDDNDETTISLETTVPALP